MFAAWTVMGNHSPPPPPPPPEPAYTAIARAGAGCHALAFNYKRNACAHNRNACHTRDTH